MNKNILRKQGLVFLTATFLILSGCSTSSDIANTASPEPSVSSKVTETAANVTSDDMVAPTPVDAGIYVEYNPAVDEDFITGVDISSYLSLVDSGVIFHDFDGKELSKQEFFDFLHENGVNYVRTRVWIAPYDSKGNGYGGGNNDLDKAIEMGQYATNAGMKLLVNFHYSDFWADPAKQAAPKEWEPLTVDTKAAALSAYTTDALNALLNAGVDVGMVQIGNETTSKFCGESDWKDICTLLSAGTDATRATSEDIRIAIHFTNPERTGSYDSYAAYLETYGVDYDIFASSYYPYWHGTTDNLTSELRNIVDKYGKQVMVVETSWAYTLEDGDGHSNTVKSGSNDHNQPYEFSVQGQATELAAVTKAVTDVGESGIGIFYWEPAWLPVQYAYNTEGNLDEITYNSNRSIWETCGSGWASSYAAEYDPDDAGKWYGGSAVDNQALWDFTGHPLESLKTYSYLRTGTNAPKPEPFVATDNETSDIINLLTEPGFEEELTGWMVEGFDTFDAASNARTGSGSLHFYADSADMNFTATQEVTLEKGTYSYTAYLEGGDAGTTDEFIIYVTVGDITYQTAGTVSTWQNWCEMMIEDIVIPEDGTAVTVGISVNNTTAGVWGAFDDCILTKTAD